jgi:hypothetical protein
LKENKIKKIIIIKRTIKIMTQSGKKINKMLRDKIERKKNKEKDKKTMIKRMCIIFDIKIKQNQMEMNEIEKQI